MTSEELYRRCAANDQNAWAYTYSYVICFLRKTRTRYPDCEDIAHDTLLYFIDGGLQRIRRPRAFKQWLRLKARGFLIDRYRSAHPQVSMHKTDEYDRPMGENPAVKSAEPGPDKALFLENVLTVLEKALKAIGSECKTLLERYFKARFMGEKIRQIARETGRPESTVRVMIHRCHRKLAANTAYKALLDELED